MRIEVADVAGMHLAGLWHRGPYERISDTFATLFPRLEALGLDQLPAPTLVAVYYDDPRVTSADELRSFAAVTIAEGAPTGDLHEVRLPGGRFLRGEFIGPHDQIAEGWTKLNERLAEGRYTSRAAESFEVYVRNDDGAPSDQDRTDLHLPVA
jgi:AraC family transcriptional regulator